MKLKTLTNRPAFAFSMLLAAGGRRHRAGTAGHGGHFMLNVAAFAKKSLAEEWAQMRSWSDESRLTVHTATEVFVFQDGEEVR